MRELTVRVPKGAVEEVLDQLLAIVPGGVREVERGRGVELRMRGAELPEEAEIKRAVASWPHLLSAREVADDWRQRRLDDYEPNAIGGKLVVRPEWAPRSPKATLDIVLSETGAFGGGTHVTTRTCLAQLLQIKPCGGFADLGCGTGVLAILAVRLGWSPVIAVDVQPSSVEAAAANAEANGAAVVVSVLDLAAQPPPAADGIAANFPAALHQVVAPALPDPAPRVALLSGFGPDEADTVATAYGARGLSERRRIDSSSWTVLLLRRD